VYWSPPSSDGGTYLNGYQVISNGGEACWTSGSTERVLTNLTPGNQYWLSVRAANVVGYGANSNEVWETPTTVPSAPTGCTVAV